MISWHQAPANLLVSSDSPWTGKDCTTGPHQRWPAFTHADYHFWRSHQMAIGRAELQAISGFGTRAHVRLKPVLKPTINAGIVDNATTTMVLVMCGGSVVVTWRLSVPAETSECATHAIMNDSNTAPWTAGDCLHSVDSRVATPEWCQKQCCANQACTGWTFVENVNKTFTCWMMKGETRAVVSAGPDCAGSTCWAAMGNTARAVRWSIHRGQ